MVHADPGLTTFSLDQALVNFASFFNLASNFYSRLYRMDRFLDFPLQTHPSVMQLG